MTGSFEPQNPYASPENTAPDPSTAWQNSPVVDEWCCFAPQPGESLELLSQRRPEHSAAAQRLLRMPIAYKLIVTLCLLELGALAYLTYLEERVVSVFTGLLGLALLAGTIIGQPRWPLSSHARRTHLL